MLVVRIRDGERLRIGEAVVVLQRESAGWLKVVIDAPRCVEVTRPDGRRRGETERGRE